MFANIKSVPIFATAKQQQGAALKHGKILKRPTRTDCKSVGSFGIAFRFK